MVINARAMIEAAASKSLGIAYYANIMNTVNQVDVSTDRDFQKAFTYFYRVRRNDEWRKAYFDYFERAKKEMPSFEEILTYLYKVTGRVEPSFSSKMLATIDPSMPIWDSIVLATLGFEVTKNAKPETKLAEAVTMYKELCNWYKDYLSMDEAKENIKVFDSIMVNYTGLSDTKKIDFIMWGSGR